MMTRNEHIEELVFSYFAGELTEAQEQELSSWLDADEENKKILFEMSDWWATAHVPVFSSTRKADFEKYFGSLMQPVQQKTGKRSLWTTWTQIAAVGLLLLSVGVTSYRLGNRNVDDTQLAYFETSAPMGSQSKVVLPDHSVVWVNAGSSLRYSKNFGKEDREIQLEGEAYFEVARDTLKPFVVKSEVLNVRVLGTRFNVKAYKEDQTIDVSLVSGKVNVHLNDKKHAEEVELRPNRMLSYNKETDRVEMTEIDGSKAYDWTNGTLRFENKSFLQIAKDLERKYNIHIRIESKSLKKEIYTGSFSGHYTLDDILREIDVEHKYAWKQQGDELVIKDK